jgi:hypothetical protein
MRLSSTPRQSRQFQCLVVLVHHTPVADDDRLRGKSSLFGGLDVSIISKREKGSFVATMTIKKMRDEDETQSFTVNLVRVVLGHTKKGREVSTLVVATADPGPAKDAKVSKKLPDSAKNALSALKYALTEVGAIPPASNHIPGGQKCVSPKQWREYANMTSTLPEGDTRDKRSSSRSARRSCATAATSPSRWPRSPSHGIYSLASCG